MRRRYDNSSILRVQTRGAARLAALLQNCTFWTPTDVHVTAAEREAVVAAARAAGVGVRVLIADVQRLIDGQQQKPQRGRATFEQAEYRSYDDTMTHVAALVAAHPTIASTTTIGLSFEGRKLEVVRLSAAGGGTRPGLWLQALLHAREWLSGGALLVLLQRLLALHAASSERVVRLLERFDVYLLPIANPDGYAHAFTVDRLWRKNRAPNAGSACVGTDLNRNFDDHWSGVAAGVATSRDPCADFYHGPSAASEPEVAAIASFVRSRALVAFIDWHTYSAFWLTPQGWSTDAAPDAAAHDAAAAAAVGALRSAHGVPYVALSAAAMYRTTGTAQDWAYAQGIVQSITIEGRPAADASGEAQYGFLAPPSEIVPHGEEVLEGLLALAEHLMQLPPSPPPPSPPPPSPVCPLTKPAPNSHCTGAVVCEYDEMCCSSGHCVKLTRAECASFKKWIVASHDYRCPARPPPSVSPSSPSLSSTPPAPAPGASSQVPSPTQLHPPGTSAGLPSHAPMLPPSESTGRSTSSSLGGGGGDGGGWLWAGGVGAAVAGVVAVAVVAWAGSQQWRWRARRRRRGGGAATSGSALVKVVPVQTDVPPHL